MIRLEADGILVEAINDDLKIIKACSTVNFFMPNDFQGTLFFMLFDEILTF